MAANPNPDRITQELWDFWEAFQRLEPSVRYGGTYVNKPGYHGTRAENKVLDYSVRDPQDQLGPDDKTAAIDLTFPDAQAGRYDTIIRYSSRLLASGVDPDDPRGDYLREFYGQADVDTTVEGWDFRYLRTVTSDSSHLWHIHISFSREHVANPAAMRALLSILKGETVAQWQSSDEEERMAPDTPVLSVVLDGTTARYTWNTPDGHGKAVDEVIFRLADVPFPLPPAAADGNIDTVHGPWGTAYNHEGVELGKTYYAQVLARNTDGWSQPGSLMLVTAKPSGGAGTPLDDIRQVVREELAKQPKPLTFEETVAAANKAEDQ